VKGHKSATSTKEEGGHVRVDRQKKENLQREEKVETAKGGSLSFEAQERGGAVNTWAGWKKTLFLWYLGGKARGEGGDRCGNGVAER